MMELRQLVLRLPEWVAVTLVSTVSVVSSVLALLLVSAVTPSSDLVPGAVLVSVLVPLLVATPVSAMIVNLLHEVEAARKAALLLAWEDELTRVFNRRRLLDLARREEVLHRRASRPLGVLLVDLDGFKAVNDTWGHAVGDEVLRAAAQAARGALRSTDLLARWGGEEFAVVLPDADAATAAQVAERVAAAIRGAVVDVGDRPVGCTASVGVAVLEPGEVFEAALQRADAAMYRAKAAGKDRVIAA